MLKFFACLALVILILTPVSARAVYLSESGTTAKLYGQIEAGDEKLFAEFLARPRQKPLQVLYLDSFGGSVGAGILIGRLVRQAKLSTAVNATANHCDSSCTLIFASGVKRFNIHGEQIEEGYNSLSGLGYHRAFLKGASAISSLSSDKGTDAMAAFYAEMGSPGAAEILRKGRGNSMYRPSGKTSLDLRIATSLGEP